MQRKRRDRYFLAKILLSFLFSGTASPAFADTWTSACFNFRDTAIFVTDPSSDTAFPQGCTYVRVEDGAGVGDQPYPITRNLNGSGLQTTFGTTCHTDNRRDRNVLTGDQAVMSGISFANNNAAFKNEFRLLLPTAGTYNVGMALGDYNNNRTLYKVVILDTDHTTVLKTITVPAVLSTQFADASGVVRTSPADWVANNVKVPIVFSGTTAYVQWGYGDGLTLGETDLAHLDFTLASSPDTAACFDDNNTGTFSVVKTAGLKDRDCDGELSKADGGPDCDDTSPVGWSVYKGSYNRVDATHYQQCDPAGSGNFTASTTAQLAECATNYYIDAGAGNDANPGTFASPFATFGPVTRTNGNNGAHSTFSGQTCIYFMGTTDLTVPVTRTPTDGDGYTRVGFETDQSGPSSSAKNLLARYPTSIAKINFTCDATNSCVSFHLEGDNWIIRGFEMTGGYGATIKFEGQNTEVVGNYIHDTPGNNDDNQSQIKDVDGVSSLRIHHNILGNNYDPTRTGASDDRQNVNFVTIFTGVSNLVDHNSAGYNHPIGTAPFYNQGGGMRIKHGQAPNLATAPTIFRDDIIYNTERMCLEGGTPSTYMIGNLCYHPERCINVRDPGNGFYYIDDMRAQNNTCITGSHDTGLPSGQSAITFEPYSIAPGLTANPITGLLFSGNVIDDSLQTTYSGSDALISIFNSGTDVQFTAMIPSKFTFTNNCYYNSSIPALTAGFNVFGDNSASSFGSVVNFANWKLTPYFFDLSGVNGNPTFGPEFQATANCPAIAGWNGDWPTSPSIGGHGGRKLLLKVN